MEGVTSTETPKAFEQSDLQVTDDPPIPQWFWQSGPDPWKEKDSNLWTWTPYQKDICICIEKAYLLNQATADIGDYEIINLNLDLRNTQQVNKIDRHKARRVKREGTGEQKSRFLLELPTPLPIEKSQKTINDAFGSVQHFLDYIMKRTTESYQLFHRLKDLDLDCKESEYKDIMDEVISSIHKGAEKRELMVRSKTMAQSPLNFIFEAHCITKEIVSNTGSLRDFLRTILRVYTMESFICYWLNELLRSEDWEAINILTPYLVCLAYTFKLQEYVMKYEASKSTKWFFGLLNTNTLTLYRGTALPPDLLNYYDPVKNKYFSWNGVTSTSRNKVTALTFINFSLNKAKDLNESKVGILFKIQVDFSSPKDCEGMIDISQNSKFPGEEEIILAPGTVFKLISLKPSKNGRYKVNLMLKKEFEKDQENVFLLGALQGRVILKDRAILDDLTEDEFIKVLQLLEGNQLVTKMQILNCLINSHLLELIDNMRATTNLAKEDILVKGNKIFIDNFSLLSYYFPPENLSDLCQYNTIVFRYEAKKVELKDKQWKMEKLCLTKQALETLSKNSQIEELFKRAQNEFRITYVSLEIKDLLVQEKKLDSIMEFIKVLGILQHLSLDFENCFSITDRELTLLKNSLKDCVALNHLSLNFKGCTNIQDKEISTLSDTVKLLICLKNLSLNFFDCSKISDQGMQELTKGLKSLQSLHHLSLNFHGCEEISDDSLINLEDGLRALASLQFISLVFSGCTKVTDKGMNSLTDSLQILPCLQHLSLDFTGCSKISNEGMSILKEVLKKLTFLERLSLLFGDCSKLSDEGVGSLAESLQELVFIQHLSIDFGGCLKISDKGMSSLKDSLKLLTVLKHLTLDFGGCTKISDVGMASLKDGLQDLISLHHLSLVFWDCSLISDVGMLNLKEGIKKLVSLQHLAVNFYKCSKISNKGLNSLREGLKVLKSLSYLSLDYGSSKEISDIGMASLKNFFETIPLLQYLSLNFCNSAKISSEGMNCLKDGLKALVSLNHLSLDFSRCSEIMDEGITYLAEGLSMLSSLEYLSLVYSGCSRISDEGISKLKDALKALTSLRYLSLSFSGCAEISDESVKSLRESFKAMTDLKSLSLNFSGCSKISGESVANIKYSLKTLKSLENLSLNFLGCFRISDESIKVLDAGRKSLKFMHNFSFQS